MGLQLSTYTPQERARLINRLLRHTDLLLEEPGCWLWRGARISHGYGSVRIAGKTRYAHRLAYELVHGPVPTGQVVCHTCDNPLCINPGHLFIGTQADNLADMARKGRSTHGARNPHAKLTALHVEEIRRRYAAGGVLQRELADEYGVHQNAISRVITGARWKERGDD